MHLRSVKQLDCVPVILRQGLMFKAGLPQRVKPIDIRILDIFFLPEYNILQYVQEVVTHFI